MMKLLDLFRAWGRHDRLWHWIIRLTFLLLAILGFVTLMGEISNFVWIATGGQ